MPGLFWRSNTSQTPSWHGRTPPRQTVYMRVRFLIKQHNYVELIFVVLNFILKMLYVAIYPKYW